MTVETQPVIYDVSSLTEYDIYLFKEGSNFRLYEKFGAHIRTVQGISGTHFAVWAPNARSVAVVGDFNNWDWGSHYLKSRPDDSGIWEGFIPGIAAGTLYKYAITSNYNNYKVLKGDPFAFAWEQPPRTASVVADLTYTWRDHKWLKRRFENNKLSGPISIYEVHLGSWRRPLPDYTRFLTYEEMGPMLADYAGDMGFSHVEFMPVMEHPFYGSWGYQTLGYFAPTSRFGPPTDFMAMVDHLHEKGIGVILDWVPSHFPSDEYGLAYFDGTHLFEHEDPRQGYHPDWNSYIFNYGRNEIRSFLISSAIFWLEKYHADGLRVDAVASMLYRDYSRKEGEWIPNKYGGRENLEAIDFLRVFNKEVYKVHPDVQTFAEESTAWPLVSKPTYLGGLGFGMKWNMGWMHDTLKYFQHDPVYRKYLHNELTFSIWYAFYENFVLALSHDEVVHGKGSLIGKMAGDDWQKFANLRLMLGYMFTHPGKKLLFMGAEFAQRSEWNHESSLEWHLLQYAPHQGIQNWVRQLNRIYTEEPALHELDFEQAGFEWLDFHDVQQSVVSFLRRPAPILPKAAAEQKTVNSGTQQDSSAARPRMIVVACNFTPVPRHNYRLGVPVAGVWTELLNSDAKDYGGSGQGNLGSVETRPVPFHGREHSISLTLPPLGIVVLKSPQVKS
jgi:1,4-alpha-glucan branching enzyme